MKDEYRLKLWLEAIQRENFKPTTYTKICSDHFTPDSWMERPGINVPYLKNNAVPSIFKTFEKKVPKSRGLRSKILKRTSDEAKAAGEQAPYASTSDCQGPLTAKKVKRTTVLRKKQKKILSSKGLLCELAIYLTF